LEGLRLGVIAWATYGIVEIVFVSLVPWMFVSTTSHWVFSSILFVLYSACGAVLGGLNGWGVHLAWTRTIIDETRARQLLRAIPTATIAGLYATNLLLYGNRASGGVVLCFLLSLVLLVMSIGSALSRRWAPRLVFATNPGTVCLLLVGLPWFSRSFFVDRPALVRGAGFLGVLSGVLLLSFFIRRLNELLGRVASSWTVTAHGAGRYAVIGVAVLMVHVTSALLNRIDPGLTVSSESTENARSGPNVVLITLDTVRADHLSVYGYERHTTPNLEAFAADATLYTNAIASADMTLPTHASIFTGVSASRHGAHATSQVILGQPLPPILPTLAERLSDLGYLTMTVAANAGYLGRAWGLDRGFHYYDARPSPVFLRVPGEQTLGHRIGMMIAGRLSERFEHVTRRAAEINRSVFGLLDEAREASRPFFMFINYMDAHGPYVPEPPFDRLYPGKNDSFSPARWEELSTNVMELKRGITGDEQRHLISQYDGEIAYLDVHLGELLARLKILHFYDSSLIIVTSDHGEAFGERHLLTHGVSAYQDLLHVPLLIKYPRVRSGVTATQIVSSLDLMPTILDVVQGELPVAGDGETLASANRERDKVVIAESFPSDQLTPLLEDRFDRVERALFQGSLKFVSSTQGKRECYDLASDPNEQVDLHESSGEACQELEGRLEDWVSSVSGESHSGEEFEVDPETLDRLRSLGYVR